MTSMYSSNSVTRRIQEWGKKLTPSDAVFDQLVANAEQLYKSEPRFYKQKLIAWGLIGYAYIFMISLLLGAITCALLLFLLSENVGFNSFFTLFMILGIPVLAIARSIWVKFPAPDGVEVERHEAPKLFELIDELSTKIGTQVDKVIIDTEFNAAITQLPRLGLFGFQQNYLIIGLPLIQTFDYNQFKATLAHELGHLSGNHSKSSAWAYGLRERWSRVLNSMEGESPLGYALFYLFFCWYSPRFSAYSMVRAREQEFQADRDSALLTSNETLAEMLAMLRLRRYWHKKVVDDFWKKLYHLEKPPSDYHNQIFASLFERPQKCEGEELRLSSDPEQWLIESLSEKTKGGDTHPCFKDRIDSAGQLENYSDTASSIERLLSLWSPDKTASQICLGEKLEEVTNALNSKFVTDSLDYWQSAHIEGIREKKLLANLRAKDSKGKKLTVEELNRLAYFIERIEGKQGSLPYSKRVLELDPDNPQANYSIGYELITEKHDDKGIEHLRKAMNGKTGVVEDACNSIILYLERFNREGEIPEFRELLEAHSTYIDIALEERQGVTYRDKFETHELSDEWIEVWRPWFAQIDEVERVHVVKKKVQNFPEFSYHAIGLILNREIEKNLIAHTMLAYLGKDSFCVYLLLDSFDISLIKSMEMVENSIVYNRSEHMHLARE